MNAPVSFAVEVGALGVAGGVVLAVLAGYLLTRAGRSRWPAGIPVVLVPAIALAAITLGPVHGAAAPGHAATPTAPAGDPVQVVPGAPGDPFPSLRLRYTGTSPVPLSRWRPDGVPASHGLVGTVVIPATTSGFRARPAVIYLPPAALTPEPPRLPVVVAMSGQSAHSQPSNVMIEGAVPALMDAVAARHHGAAPIVVVPDQLGVGTPPPNPMCVDSTALGRSATWITVDVRRWILQNLPVSSDRAAWTIAGFSQGGTCAIQFGAGDPRLFGSIVDVSGELAPKNGTLAHTVQVGFGGNERAYLAATPVQLLKAHRFDRSTTAYFSVGQLDTKYTAEAEPVVAAARASGMAVHFRLLPKDGHNWKTGHDGLAWGFAGLEPGWGLP